MKISIRKIGDTELEITRWFKASPAAVFDAHVDPMAIRRWVLGPDGWTMPECVSEPVPGGQIRFRWQNENGETFSLNGNYLSLVRPDRIVHTEAFDSDPPMPPAEVMTSFVADGDGTRIEMRIRYESRETRDGLLASEMTEGMESSYERLESVLTGT